MLQIWTPTQKTVAKTLVHAVYQTILIMRHVLLALLLNRPTWPSVKEEILPEQSMLSLSVKGGGGLCRARSNH